ncbi:helix-turn-helix domain-containing protein [Oxalobacteraceae bacterium A2-2]
MNSEWAEAPKDQGQQAAATPGAQLAAQRQAMGLSVEQIADQLKLAPRQVVALEAGDYAALPNMAVTRGFVRAYAKVVKLDPAPLVAMVEAQSPGTPALAPVRRELPAAKFSESRLSLTERSSKPAGWMVGAAVAVVVLAAGAYAWHAGLVPAGLFSHKEEAAADSAAAASAPPDTALVKQEQAASAPLLSPTVPLVSVPPQGEAGAAGAAPAVNGASGATAAATPPAANAVNAANAAPAVAPAVTAPAPAAASPAAGASAPAAAVQAPAAGSRALVLTVNKESWIEIRRPGATPLISRLVKAGSTETFDIKDPALLIVGNPAGVQATLGGQALPLPPVAGGTISRVNIK